MTVLPVIERELRAESRHSSTYGLRVLAVAAALAMCLVFGIDRGFSDNSGGRLFGYLNFILACAIWIVVPLLTADCISRERREGTLGLLFLTPLKAREIVIAKSMAHGLRALTLWAAILPVMIVPFLLGGVTWKDAVISFLINFSAICWALSAGVLGSSRMSVWTRAIVLSMGCAFVFFFIFTAFAWLSAVLGIAGRNGITTRNLGLEIFSIIMDYGGYRGMAISTMTSAMLRGWILGWVGLAIISVGFLFLIVRIAALGVRKGWQIEPPSARRLWWEKTFCRPVLWLSFFKWWMRQKLQRNPIGWLEQRTWTGRAVTWGWFAVIISLYSAAFSEPSFHRRGISELQNFMGWVLMITIAASSAGSFRRERESGVLELLLVAPLSVSEIIKGRLRGLWGQFLPAVLMLLGVWYYFDGIYGHRNDGFRILFHAITFLTLPVIGLYYSLRFNNFIGSFLAALIVGVLFPLTVLNLLAFGWNYFVFRMLYTTTGPSFVPSLIQIGLAIYLYRKLHRNLTKRTFALNATS